jgi:hypothetical protein
MDSHTFAGAGANSHLRAEFRICSVAFRNPQDGRDDALEREADMAKGQEDARIAATDAQYGRNSRLEDLPRFRVNWRARELRDTQQTFQMLPVRLHHR